MTIWLLVGPTPTHHTVETFAFLYERDAREALSWINEHHPSLVWDVRSIEVCE